MRTLLMALAAVLAAAGMASAQVAAPSLNPTPSLSGSFRTVAAPFFTPVPSNPAVLSWDGPSRIGAAYGPSKLDDAQTGQTDAKGNASGVLAEIVGEMFAAGVQLNSDSEDLQPASAQTGTIKSSVQQIGIAAQFGKRFSIGVQSQVLETKLNTGGGNTDIEESGILPGATVRLGETIYLGAAGGSTTVKDKVSNLEAKHSVMQYGVGYMYRDKERGAHLEVYKAKRASAYFPGGVALASTESDVTGGTIEVLFSKVHLGYSAQTDKVKDPTGAAPETDTLSTVSVGYNPGQGLAIVASQSSGKSTNDTTGLADKKTRSTTVGVAYQF